MLESQNKRSFVKPLVYFGIAIAAAAALFLGSEELLFQSPLFPGLGGTPVILVGDSVKLDAHDHILVLEFVDWKPENSGDGYWARGRRAITSISVQYPDNTQYAYIDTTGKDISLTIKVQLCGASTSTIQVNQVNSDHIIHATPPAPEKFVYDKKKKELVYEHMQAACPGGGTVLNKFLSISGTAGGTPFGPIPCQNAASTIGLCQVVMKE